jgi:glycosyltransferase involved in cell wall biosynthesis/hydroxymethylpyrimidine pyrophosphatase-like HAD family hydrolase
MTTPFYQVPLDEFRKSFSGSDRLMALFHVQGDVSAGFSEISDPDYREIFGNPNMPNYQNNLASSRDTGGQTSHVFEKLFHVARQGTPSIMFSMSRNPHLTEPQVVLHSSTGCYIVYLPHTVYKDAGIPDALILKSGADKGLVSKETLMAHPAVFDEIAKQALDFLEKNIPNFHQKRMLFLSGHYIDGGQSVLKIKQKIAREGKFEGDVSAIWNPHTLGIDKLQSLLKAELDLVQAYLAGFGETPEKEAVARHPIIQDQWNILEAISSGGPPHVVAKMIGEYLGSFEARLPDFLDTYDSLGRLYSEPAALKNICLLSRDEMERNIRQTLPALNQAFSFKNRLELESPAEASGFDGIAVTSEKMKGQMKEWVWTDPLFVRSGIDQTIFNPNAIQPDKEGEVLNCAAKLMNQAWRFEGHDSAPVRPEDLTNATVFVAISRPDERKGSDLCIEAFAKYLSTHKGQDAYLVLGAHKPASAENPSAFFQKLEGMVCGLSEKYGVDLKDRVKFLPPLKSYECRTLYGLPRAVGLSPSQNEPWGIVGVEQLASGIPVIGSDEYASICHFSHKPGAKESIRLFPSPIRIDITREHSVDSFSKAMDDVSRNYDAMKNSAEIFAHDVLRESSWSSMAARYHDFMTDLCLRKRVIPAADLGVRAMVIQDVDGSLTPHIHEATEERRPHVAFEALRRQTNEIRAAGGFSVLATGRPLHMLQNDPLLKDYIADYAISSAGVEISRREGSQLVLDEEYDKFLLTVPPGKTPFDTKLLETALRGAHSFLSRQPSENVSGQRLGYYMAWHQGDSLELVKTRVHQLLHSVVPRDMDYRFAVSLDPELKQWNIDLMPSKATGKGAVEWLLKKMNGDVDTAIVCGGGTGDILALDPQTYKKFGVQPSFIAPANASDAVRSTLNKLLDRRDGTPVHFFVGHGAEFHDEYGGPGGILEGMRRLLPQLKEKVRQCQTPGTHVEDPAGRSVAAAGRGK